MTIDSHCHLNQSDYAEPIDNIVQRAQQAGVQHILAVACDPNDFEELKNQLQTYSMLYGAFAIHPEYAHLPQDLNQLKEYLCSSLKVVALGRGNTRRTAKAFLGTN